MPNHSADWTLHRLADHIAIYRRGPDLKIVLSRPRKGNVLSLDMIQALTVVYREAGTDSTIFRVMLTAEGKYFCTGMDLGAKGGVLDDDQEAKQRQWHLLQTLFEAIDECPKVTLALVNGPAFGAGIGLVFASDNRIASSNATFNVSEAKVGLAPAVTMKWVLREWGTARGREAMLTARAVKAQELESAGTVHTVVHDIELEQAAERYIAYLNACGPDALAAVKHITLLPESDREKAIKATYDEMMEPSEEARHGVESFHAKMPPDWINFKSGSKSKM